MPELRSAASSSSRRGGVPDDAIAAIGAEDAEARPAPARGV
mgnify:CR=1 FL=1